MEININFSEECIHNLAFTRALLIKCRKEKLKKQILKELKETWKSMFPELESQAKRRF